MKNLSPVALAAIAVALAGTAYAATRNTHSLNVTLPDGAIAHVEYVGDVPPKVSITPAPLPSDFWTTGTVPELSGFDRMLQQLDRQMRQVEQMARQPMATSNMNVASYGSLPAGAESVSVVSISNGGGTCTRRTEVVAQGAGKPPKVTSNVSGNCGAPAQASPDAARKRTALDRT